VLDDATSRLSARFVRRDSTEENMRMLWSYLEEFGRPLGFYTDKASLFRNNEKRRRDEPGLDKDPAEVPPTQIGRALRELGITWIAAHSPQAKGRVERNFGTARDRLVKGMRGGLEDDWACQPVRGRGLPMRWEQDLTVEPAHADNAHRPPEKAHCLASSLSHVEARQLRNDYSFRWEASSIRSSVPRSPSGMRGAAVRVEQRSEGLLAARYGERYVEAALCHAPAKAVAPSRAVKQAAPPTRSRARHPKIWQAARTTGGGRGTSA
jgi:hypothetical protein